jgi:hypothetical protein
VLEFAVLASSDGFLTQWAWAIRTVGWISDTVLATRPRTPIRIGLRRMSFFPQQQWAAAKFKSQ